MSNLLCRARTSPHCENGHYIEPDDLRMDSTWNGRSVICHYCFFLSGVADSERFRAEVDQLNQERIK